LIARRIRVWCAILPASSRPRPGPGKAEARTWLR
jgi:hypothetical protein